MPVSYVHIFHSLLRIPNAIITAFSWKLHQLTTQWVLTRSYTLNILQQNTIIILQHYNTIQSWMQKYVLKSSLKKLEIYTSFMHCLVFKLFLFVSSKVICVHLPKTTLYVINDMTFNCNSSGYNHVLFYTSECQTCDNSLTMTFTDQSLTLSP